MYKGAGKLGLTKNEALFDRVSHKRFLEIFHRADVSVVSVSFSENNYGEFLFVTLWGAEDELGITFYGCGYHDRRERWFVDEWYLFDAYPSAPLLFVDKTEALSSILDYYHKAKAEKEADKVSGTKRSKEAIMFEEVSEICGNDDDAAQATLEDMDII